MDKPMAVSGGILHCRSQKGFDPAAFFQPLPLPSSVSWIWAKLNFSQPSWLASGHWASWPQLSAGWQSYSGVEVGKNGFSEVSKGGDVSKDQSQVVPIVLPVLYPGDLET